MVYCDIWLQAEVCPGAMIFDNLKAASYELPATRVQASPGLDCSTRGNPPLPFDCAQGSGLWPSAGTMTVCGAAVFAPRIISGLQPCADSVPLGLGLELGLGLGDPWVTQGWPKGHPSVAQGRPKRRIE
jgi:hypothetical protein